ncbi:hypothetical protein SDC9_143693 [bioreactor metagenome]|uniref:Uncharacterized protein n=1 Tax=bioreactor metagenome TaxID=1076179 RepID=A0A645E4R3_9ZZZZ
MEATDRPGIVTDPFQQRQRARGPGAGQGDGLAPQRLTGAVLLPAAPVATRADLPVGHDAEVSPLAGHAPSAAVDLAVQDQATADAGAEGDHREGGAALPGAEPVLPPGRRIGVVVDHHRQIEAGLETLHQRFVAPGEVRREPYDPAGLVDPAGGADPDGAGVVVTRQGIDEPDDRFLDGIGPVGRRGDRTTPRQPSVGAHDGGRHLRPTDVDPDRRPLLHCGHVRLLIPVRR